MSKKDIGGKTYWEDAKGTLVPEEMIKPVDRMRDELVTELFKKATELQAQMQQFKTVAFADVEAFITLSAEKYGAEIGGKKGNISLFSFDGKYKLQIAVADNIRFDERIHAAKALIDTCLHEWSADSRPELPTK